MNLLQEKALFHLTGKHDLVDLKVELWQQLAGEHPYFAPAQFFLASKLKQEEHSLSGAQLLRTNFYFTNAYWLQFQLQHGLKNKEEAPLAEPDFLAVETPAVSATAVTAGAESNSRDEQYAVVGEAVIAPDDYAGQADDGADEAVSETNGADNKIAGILSGQLADFKKPLDADAKLDIEANEARLHTIDYFASQGIKIDLSKIPQDKLTTHLRKFTDWLKQMKNAQASEQGMDNNLELEKAVMETAKMSNEAREILTETMADVLAKQGQVDKAIQLFIKLSFLNPEKSSYFAAKIEQLKGI